MTTAPFVELYFNPTQLRPQDLPRAGAYLGSSSQALEAALAVARAAVVNKMKEEVTALPAPTHNQLLRIADLAWQAGFYNFRKVSAPIMADAYRHAYQAAEAGDVADSVVYSLAEAHAEKIGEYFHTSSREALSEGFTTLVNRRVPAKAAADMVLEAYGLAPRQMRAYTAASQFRTPIANVIPMPIKRKAKAYIDKAFLGRIKKLSAQEEHNIDEQAKQYAWMWLQDKGRLSQKAEKLWITAKDERVCKVCGPLHGKKVGVNERFVTAEGAFWTPGLHPNCRCVVRLIENKFSKDLYGTQLADFNRLHPRGDGGRFGTKTRVKTLEAEPRPTPQRTHDPELERLFNEVISTIPPNATGVPQGLQRPVVSVPGQVSAQVLTPVSTAGPKASVAGPKASVAGPKASTGTRVSTGTKVSVGPKVSTEATTKPATKTRTGTIAPAKVDHVYAVYTPNEYTGTGTPRDYRINPDIQFSASEELAAKKASDFIKSQVDAHIERIMSNGAMVQDAKQEGVYYRLDQKQVRRVVEGYARAAPYLTAFNPDPAAEAVTQGDELVFAQRVNDMGNPVRGHTSRVAISVRDFAKAQALDSFNFDVQIGRVNLNEAERSSSTVLRDREKYGFEGDFRTTGFTRFTRDQEYNAGIVELHPRKPPKKHD